MSAVLVQSNAINYVNRKSLALNFFYFYVHECRRFDSQSRPTIQAVWREAKVSDYSGLKNTSGAPGGSVGRAGAPYAEALSSPWRP